MKTSKKVEKIKKVKFSWQTPIEKSILDFVRSMRKQFELQQTKREKTRFLFWKIDLDKEIKEWAKNYADAYRTVEEYILKEIESRK